MIDLTLRRFSGKYTLHRRAKVKGILLVVFFLLFINNCFAAVINNGKLLYHKEWVTGKGAGHFQENGLDEKGKSPSKLTSHGTEDIIIVNSRVRPINYTVLTNVAFDFFGSVKDSVKNLDSLQKDYQIETTFCLYEDTPFDDEPLTCLSSIDQITLGSAGDSSISKQPTLSYTFNREGKYRLLLETSIKRNHTTYFVTSDEKYLTVVDKT
jgi:hypothetical protein